MPVEEREHHTPHRVDGQEPHAIVVAERADTLPAWGTGEIEAHLLEVGVIRPPQANVHRAMDDDGGGVEGGGEVARAAVSGDNDVGPADEGLGEAKGERRLIGEARHRWMGRSGHDASRFVSIPRAAVNHDPGLGVLVEEEAR